MASGIRRRSWIKGVVIVSAAAWAGLASMACSGGESGAGGDGGGGGGTTTTTAQQAPIVRKNAADMSHHEIDRFIRAYEYAVAKGFFDDFNDEHYDHHRHHHHGADVQATSPITTMSMPREAGFRLLPWHRAFLLEAESMLRAALRMRNEEEGKDPAEADLLYMPYWDSAHEQDLPQWIYDFQPKGGTAIVPPGLPEGHAGYGKEVGERYDIVFGRWPRGNLAFDTLQTTDYVARILANDNFEDFYDALDTNPEVVIANYAKAQEGLATLEQKLPDSAAVKTLSEAFSQPPGGEGSEGGGTEVADALFEIDWVAAVEERKEMPDVELIAAVKDVFSVFNFMPHLRMHLWAGGLSPDNANVRGTVTYFNELTVDPVFWLIHGELDRYWYTWEKSHEEQPPLEGEDREFNPISAKRGEWYGGGKTYSLDELTAHETLPYTYDALFAP